MSTPLIIELNDFTRVIEPLALNLAAMQASNYPAERWPHSAQRETARRTIQWMVARLIEDRFLVQVENYQRSCYFGNQAREYFLACYDTLEVDFYNGIRRGLSSRLLPFSVDVVYLPNLVYVFDSNTPKNIYRKQLT